MLENGKVEEINVKPVKGRKPLSDSTLNDFKIFVETYADWNCCLMIIPGG